MLIYNNLLINGNSKKYQPFLLNLISGRRRLLLDNETELVRKMQTASPYDEETQQLFDKLIREKQFFTDEMRDSLEASFEVSGYWNQRTRYAKDYRFSIELTRSCNMNCSFCYASSRRKASSMTKSHIDAIMAFYKKYADDPKKIEETPFIRITGGEPLYNEETAGLVRYVADKWPNAKIMLFTNGINLLKYYHLLPIERLYEVHVSLDSIPEIHLKHRYSRNVPDVSVYENIIGGIQKLLKDNVDVKVKTILDRNTYPYFDEFRQLLKDRGILDSPHCEQNIGIALDFHNDYDIMENANTIQDIEEIESHISPLGIPYSTYPGLSVLQRIMARTENKPCLPGCARCNFGILGNYHFSCNGNIYFCDLIEEDRGILGTFYPEASLDEKAVDSLYNRTILSEPKCVKCAYKYVCLGGCLHSSTAKGQRMNCGIFQNEELLDNLEFDYVRIVLERQKANETGKTAESPSVQLP